MRRLFSIFAALALAWLGAAQPAAAQFVPRGGGPIVQIDASWPVTTPNSGCWTLKVRNPHAYLPDSAPEYIGLLRGGFDASGKPTYYPRDLIITARVRQPYPAVTGTSDRAAVQQYMYRSDVPKDRGILNRCNTPAPQPVANFALFDRGVIDASITQEVVAFSGDAQRNSQVASVICRATDTNGLVVYSTPVSAMTISGQPYDLHPVIDYTCTVDTSTLAAGLIKFDAAVYPWYGDNASIADSANSTDPARFSTRYYLKNATLAASPQYAWVCPAAGGTDSCSGKVGNNSNACVSATSATALATPCLTIDGAILKANATLGKVDGVIVRVGAGTWAMVDPGSGSPRTQNVGEVVITKDPAVADSAVTIGFGTSVYCPRFTGFTSPVASGALRFSHIAFVKTGIQGFNCGNTTDLIWNQVTWDGGGFNANYLSNTANDAFFGATLSNTGGGSTTSAQTAHEHRVHRGVSYTDSGSVESLLWLGNDFPNNALTSNTCTKSGASAASSSGAIIAFNFIGKAASQNVKTINGCDVDGFAVVQNVLEYTSAGSSNIIGLNNDGQTNNARNEILQQNTMVGHYSEGRVNLWYDEGVTPRTSAGQSCVGDIIVSLNTKGDQFRGSTNEGGTGAATASYRTGNWGYLYGVGCVGELSNYWDALNASGGASQVYPGIGAKIGTGDTNPFWIPNATFTNYQAAFWSGSGNTSTAGAGGGTYSLSAGSAAYHMNTRPTLPYDFAGNARGTTATCSGAYECAP